MKDEERMKKEKKWKQKKVFDKIGGKRKLNIYHLT